MVAQEKVNSKLIKILCSLQVTTILMLEECRRSGEQYWPESGGRLELEGGWGVEVEEEEHQEEVTTRRLLLHMGQEMRKVTQLHWRDWPDYANSQDPR